MAPRWSISRRSRRCVSFTRSGVNGELKVTKDRFELDARLGFLLGAFKDRIEGEIVKNLDLLLAQKDPTKAFEKAVARKPATKKAAAAAKKTAAAATDKVTDKPTESAEKPAKAAKTDD